MQTESYPNSSTSENDLICEELEKLFAFHDRQLSDKKKAILVDALIESKLPAGAIIAGIRKLMGDDLNSIKLGMILSAARSYVENEKGPICPDCTEGYVPMRDENGQWFSLLCGCSIGFSKRQTQKLKIWSGENSQYVNGRMLKKVEMRNAM